MIERRTLTNASATALILTISLISSCRSAPPSVSAAGSGKGEFDTRQAFDGLLEREGRRTLSRAANSSLAWGESYVQMGLMTMYQATGDRAYLDPLVERADEVLARRDSELGVTDFRGRSLPGWTTGDSYSIGEIRLPDANGTSTLYLRSSLTGYNHQTRVTVTPGAGPDTFTLEIENERYKQRDRFENVSMDPTRENYAVTRIRASKLAQPFSAMRLHAEDLDSTSVGAARNPVPVETNLEPSRYLWPVHQGMIFEPLLLFARTVHETRSLNRDARYREQADRYIAAAEELFRVLEADWRENDDGEGWYAVEKGAPVWMDGCDEPHNHFLAVGAAMIQLAAVSDNPLWRDRVEKMAWTLKNDMHHVSDGDLYVWPYWWSKGRVYDGWSPEDKVSRNTPGMTPRRNMEDFSHASIDVNFAWRCYRDGIVFTRQDLERIANTFLKNIVRRTDEGNLTFADRVDGVGGAGRYDRQGPAWPLLAEFRPGVLDVFREMRAQSPWNGYAVWILQSANMNLMRTWLAQASAGYR